MISYNPAAMESPAAALDGLRRLAVLPEWLQAALDGEQVRQALARHVPEFVAGTLRLNGCKIRRLLLKDEGGYWIGTYQLTVEGLPGEQRQQVAVRGTLAGPAASWPIGGVAAGEPQAFGSPGWLCDLPELRLRCELEQPETALAALETLMDPQAARAALEQHIRAGDPKYSELRLQACTPHILSYKPGSRCTLRYELVYPPELAGLGWPTTVIVKAYRNRKGERAYKGMQALWRTALVSGDVVAMAEPLAWIPDLRVLVQGPLPEQTSLEELLRATLRTGASAASRAGALPAQNGGGPGGAAPMRCPSRNGIHLGGALRRCSGTRRAPGGGCAGPGFGCRHADRAAICAGCRTARRSGGAHARNLLARAGADRRGQDRLHRFRRLLYGRAGDGRGALLRLDHRFGHAGGR
jgi:hypothetical protein